MKKHYCDVCNGVVDAHIESIKESYPIRGCQIEIDTECYICGICGNQVCDIELDDRSFILAYNKYRKMNGLLMPDEIQNIRKNCGVSEELFEKVLGLEERTIERYEYGNLQSVLHDNLILLMKDRFNFLWLAVRANISEDERSEIYNRFNISVDRSTM